MTVTRVVARCYPLGHRPDVRVSPTSGGRTRNDSGADPGSGHLAHQERHGLRQLADVAEHVEDTAGCGANCCAELGAYDSGREPLDHPCSLDDLGEVWSVLAGSSFEVGDCDGEVFSVVGVIHLR